MSVSLNSLRYTKERATKRRYRKALQEEVLQGSKPRRIRPLKLWSLIRRSIPILLGRESS